MTAREACDTIVLIIVGFAIGLAIFATGLGFWSMLPTKVHAAEAWPLNPTGSAQISEWFAGLMQPDQPYMSCCGRADAFEADEWDGPSGDGKTITVTITDGRGIVPTGTKIVVPVGKIKWDQGNPTGHGILFIGSQGQIYCYVVPGGV